MAQIKFFRKIDKGGLIASFNIVVGPIEIRRAKLLKTATGYMLSMPAEKYEDKKDNNKTKYYDLVRINDEDLKKEVLKAALREAGISVSTAPTTTKSSEVKDDDLPW